MFTNVPVHSQLASMRKKELPSADNKMLQLRDINHNDIGTISLSEAFKYIKPGTHLSQSTPQTYQIKALKVSPFDAGNILKGHKASKAYKRLGRSKDFPFVTTDEPSLVQHKLGRAYTLLLQGARTEFRLRCKNKQSLKDKTVDWALEHALHLRPDSIFAAMPKGSKMLVKPCTVAPENELLIWAFEHPPSLSHAHTFTPRAIKRLGTWEEPYKAITGRPIHNKPELQPVKIRRIRLK